MFGGIVKWVVEIDYVDWVLEFLLCVYYVVIFGWLGFVVLVLLEDVLVEIVDVV